MGFSSSSASISAQEYSESCELVGLMNPNLKRQHQIAVTNRLLRNLGSPGNVIQRFYGLSIRCVAYSNPSHFQQPENCLSACQSVSQRVHGVLLATVVYVFWIRAAVNERRQRAN
jgi:hypothetical protein